MRLGGPGRLDRRSLLKGGFAAAAALSAGGLLQACGSDDGGGTTKATASAAIKPRPDGDLKWLHYEQFHDPTVIPAFEKEYGVKVDLTYLANDPETITKLSSGAPYDLVTTASGFMRQLVGGKLIQAFDPGAMKNWDELSPFYQAPWYDDGDVRYTIPYGYGPTGILYRKDRIDNITHKWNDLWLNKDVAKGHIYLLNQIGDTMGASLLRNGDECSSEVEEQVVAAADGLLELKPSVASFNADIARVTANGDAWIQACWSTYPMLQGFYDSDNKQNLEFYVPDDGPLMACSTLSVGANASAPGTALLMMDWMMRPEISVKNAKYFLLKTGTKAGDAAFGNAVAKYPMFNYSDDLLPPRENWKVTPVPPASQVWAQQWARVTA